MSRPVNSSRWRLPFQSHGRAPKAWCWWSKPNPKLIVSEEDAQQTTTTREVRRRRNEHYFGDAKRAQKGKVASGDGLHRAKPPFLPADARTCTHAAVNLSAQGTTGTITGAVTDPSGAAVQGATITIRNLDTNAVSVVSSSEVGGYKVTHLLPGRYSVKIDKANYKSFQQKEIVLQMDQVAQINAPLQIGSQQET